MYKVLCYLLVVLKWVTVLLTLLKLMKTKKLVLSAVCRLLVFLKRPVNSPEVVNTGRLVVNLKLSGQLNFLVVI